MADQPKRIHVLPDQVKSKIAAGEVIEGPFSVVKELVENSLDAGATEIEVQIVDSGLKKIAVKDNGCGMDPADIELSIREHATSKIADIHDIETIASYGFRGEALSSVSSVAEVTILSRPLDQDMGARLSVSEHGAEVSGYAGPAGTTVIVENLFYNIPARRKFLKAPKTESRLIREIVLKMALVNPGVAFYLEADGKRVISLPREKDLGARLARIYGDEVAAGLYDENISDIKVGLRAFFSKPDALRASRNMQAMYINGRPVEYRYFSFLLSRAYEAVATPGKYPAAFVFIDIDPTLVDVNIHPAKREVKLFDQRYIDSLIMAAAEKALSREHLIGAGAFAESTAVDHGGYHPSPVGTARGGENAEAESSNAASLFAGGGYVDVQFPRRGATLRDGSASEISGLYREIHHDMPAFIGIAFGTYLVVEKDDSLRFIDFHAAHERIIYDSLLDNDHPPETQELLFPKVIGFPIADFHSIAENLDVFLKIGFDIEEFSDNSIIIRGIPAPVKDGDLEKIFADFIESLKTGSGGPGAHREKAAASAACHAAKRAGDELSAEDIRSLLRLIEKEGRELRCPHGRPFVYRLARGEIERLFKRS